MKPVGGFSSWLVRFTVLQKSGLQNANLELCFDCYLPERGREQTLAAFACPSPATSNVEKMLHWEQRGFVADWFDEFWLRGLRAV